MFDYLRKPRTRALIATFLTFTLLTLVIGGLVRLIELYPQQVFQTMFFIGMVWVLWSIYNIFLTRYSDSEESED